MLDKEGHTAVSSRRALVGWSLVVVGVVAALGVGLGVGLSVGLRSGGGSSDLAPSNTLVPGNGSASAVVNVLPGNATTPSAGQQAQAGSQTASPSTGPSPPLAPTAPPALSGSWQRNPRAQLYPAQVRGVGNAC